MLSMLMITPPKKRGFLASQWRKVFAPPVSAYLDSVGNSPYIKIICEEHPKGIDWHMVSAHSLEPSCRLLLPKDCECPESSGLKRFVPTKFMRRMLENFTLETLVRSPIPPSERVVTVYGSEAEIIQLIPQLVPLVGCLRIITRRPYALNDIVQDTVRKTGMTISMTDEPEAGESCILLAPFGGAGFVNVRSSAVIIAPDRPKAECAAWINKVRVAVPSQLEATYDKRYDEAEFTGAFYELGGMRSLARIFPVCGCSPEGEITSEQLAVVLKQ